MKSLAGTLLDRGARQAYRAFLLGCLGEALDRVDETAGGNARRALQQGLEYIEALDVRDLLRYGTPFFWMNLHRLNADRQGPNASRNVRDLLMMAFDSWFHLLPEGACFEVESDAPRDVILPSLGIVIPGVRNGRLRRTGPDRLEVKADGARQTIHPGDSSGPRRCAGFRKLFPGGHEAGEADETAIALADPAVAYAGLDRICTGGDLRSFAENVARALTTIGAVDEELRESIRHLIHWFVPLNMPSPSMHLSYSEQLMVGAIHLSQGYSGSRLCEAIVHEYHHNELFVLEATHDLIAHEPGPVLYSPWRPEPRTLNGLIHGAYVFTAVLKFYAAAAQAEPIQFDTPDVRARRVDLCRKVRLALLQVRTEHLTPLGLRLIAAIDADMALQERALQLNPNWPDSLWSHMTAWREANPGCAANLRIPEITNAAPVSRP
jgi:HEXXH motif-containing protein